MAWWLHKRWAREGELRHFCTFSHFKWGWWHKSRMESFSPWFPHWEALFFLRFLFNLFHFNHIVIMCYLCFTILTKVKLRAFDTLVSNSNNWFYPTTIAFSLMLHSFCFDWFLFFIFKLVFNFFNDARD